jgi:hypothetical protein
VNEDLTPDDGTDVAALAAALRADASDLDVYAKVLTSTLADALPPGMVEVERDRSLSVRLAGRPGTAVAVRVRAEDLTLELATDRSGRTQARVVKEVRGVVISRQEVTIAAWAQLLAEHLAALARQSQEASTALARLLGL